MVLTRPKWREGVAAAALVAATLLATGPATAQESVVLTRRPTLGFMVDPGPPPVVHRILPGSPVARAGIRPGDVLLEIDGRTATFDRLRSASLTAGTGDTLRIRLRRGGTEREVLVVPDGQIAVEGTVVIVEPDSVRRLAERYLEDARRALERSFLEGGLRGFEADSLVGWSFALPEVDFALPNVDFAWGGFGWGGGLPGATTARLNPGLAAYFPGAGSGLLVLDVEPGGPAARAGVEPGDVVVRANGREIETPQDLRSALKKGSGKIVVVRRGARRTLDLRR